MAKHQKGLHGSAPDDPGGSKVIQFMMKMNPLEEALSTALAEHHGTSRAELFRQLMWDHALLDDLAGKLGIEITRLSPRCYKWRVVREVDDAELRQSLPPKAKKKATTKLDQIRTELSILWHKPLDVLEARLGAGWSDVDELTRRRDDYLRLIGEPID